MSPRPAWASTASFRLAWTTDRVIACPQQNSHSASDKLALNAEHGKKAHACNSSMQETEAEGKMQVEVLTGVPSKF